jgi:predicted Zn-dependent peptidase
MALAVAGNVTVEEVLEIADRLLTKDEKVTVERAFKEEPETVVNKYVEESLALVTPVFCLGYKESHPTPERTIKETIGKSLLLDMIAGQSSDLYKELLDSGLINDTFSTEYFNGHGYAVPMFSGESLEPKKVASLIAEKIVQLKKSGFTTEEFEMVRRKHYGKTVRAFTDVDTIANGLIVSHFDNDDLFSEFKVLQDVTPEYCYDLLQNSFDEKKVVLSVISPKEI